MFTCLRSAVCSAAPTNPANGVFACEATSKPGTTCNATCADGYKASDMGFPSVTCGNDGIWSDVTGACDLIGKFVILSG